MQIKFGQRLFIAVTSAIAIGCFGGPDAKCMDDKHTLSRRQMNEMTEDDRHAFYVANMSSAEFANHRETTWGCGHYDTNPGGSGKTSWQLEQEREREQRNYARQKADKEIRESVRLEQERKEQKQKYGGMKPWDYYDMQQREEESRRDSIRVRDEVSRVSPVVRKETPSEYRARRARIAKDKGQTPKETPQEYRARRQGYQDKQGARPGWKAETGYSHKETPAEYKARRQMYQDEKRARATWGEENGCSHKEISISYGRCPDVFEEGPEMEKPFRAAFHLDESRMPQHRAVKDTKAAIDARERASSDGEEALPHYSYGSEKEAPPFDL